MARASSGGRVSSKASVRKTSLTRGRAAAGKRPDTAQANGGGEPLLVYFDDIRLVRDLLGDYDANLAVLEDRLGIEAVVNGNAVALRQAAIELFEHRLRRGAGIVRSAQGHGVAVDHRLDAETVLEYRKSCVIVAKEIAHEPDVVEIDEQWLSATVGLRRIWTLSRCCSSARQRCFPNAGLAAHTAA